MLYEDDYAVEVRISDILFIRTDYTVLLGDSVISDEVTQLVLHDNW